MPRKAGLWTIQAVSQIKLPAAATASIRTILYLNRLWTVFIPISIRPRTVTGELTCHGKPSRRVESLPARPGRKDRRGALERRRRNSHAAGALPPADDGCRTE